MTTTMHRKVRALAKANAHPIRSRFEICTPWHWTMWIGGTVLDYWPSTNRWRYQDIMHRGRIEDLVKFIEGWEA